MFLASLSVYPQIGGLESGLQTERFGEKMNGVLSKQNTGQYRAPPIEEKSGQSTHRDVQTNQGTKDIESVNPNMLSVERPYAYSDSETFIAEEGNEGQSDQMESLADGV